MKTRQGLITGAVAAVLTFTMVLPTGAAEGKSAGTMNISSSALQSAGSIPAVYTCTGMDSAMHGHVLAQAELMATYGR